MGRNLDFNGNVKLNKSRIVYVSPFSKLYSDIICNLNEGNFEELKDLVEKTEYEFSKQPVVARETLVRIDEMKDRLAAYESKEGEVCSADSRKILDDEFSFMRDLRYATEELEKFALYAEEHIRLIDRLDSRADFSMGKEILVKDYNRNFRELRRKLNISKTICCNGREIELRRFFAPKVGIEPRLRDEYTSSEAIDTMESYKDSYGRVVDLMSGILERFDNLEEIIRERNSAYDFCEDEIEVRLGLKIYAGYLNNQSVKPSQLPIFRVINY